jgi:hypothetical protein
MKIMLAAALNLIDTYSQYTQLELFPSTFNLKEYAAASCPRTCRHSKL